MHTRELYISGNTEKPTKAFIMVHGRGGTAPDIARLVQYLPVATDALIVAPQATNNTWYPHSFIVEEELNQPYLESAMEMMAKAIQSVEVAGISTDQIYFLGFSQGACVVSEFVARNAKRYGGVIVLTGGLIGKYLNHDRYKGDFEGTPIYIGTSNPDSHVPVSRVEESYDLLQTLGGKVQLDIFNNMGHTITLEELTKANEWVK